MKTLIHYQTVSYFSFFPSPSLPLSPTHIPHIAKVAQVHASRIVAEHVCRFDVQMHEPIPMQVRQPGEEGEDRPNDVVMRVNDRGGVDERFEGALKSDGEGHGRLNGREMCAREVGVGEGGGEDDLLLRGGEGEGDVGRTEDLAGVPHAVRSGTFRPEMEKPFLPVIRGSVLKEIGARIITAELFLWFGEAVNGHRREGGRYSHR